MGDRYGFRPIPTEINEEEFEALKEASERITTKPHAVKLLETWYKLDENCLPSKYILQVGLKTSHILFFPRISGSFSSELNTSGILV